ncbi:MAG: DUF4340 domain-containing protein [Planctomycetales bacterium]
MTESARTITYVVTAAVSIGVAWFFSPAANLTPQELTGAKLHEAFFPNFTDPNEPTSIRVVSFDEARAEPRIFAVEFKDGLWTIPSHHNYPADGAKRLADTANSTIGIKREEFRSSSKEDHEALGVIDPLDPDSGRLKGRGQRLTLSKGEDNLVDLIIGKPVANRAEDRETPGKLYYVRVPGEDTTYVARFNIDLSTKFKDWVETDLLKLSPDQLTEMVLDNYSIVVDGPRPRVVAGEINRLNRAKSGEPWKLEGLDDPAQEVDTTKVSDLVNSLDNLKLVGIRPKPKGLRADLTVDQDYVQSQLELQLLVDDMRQRGFEIAADREDDTKPRLYSRQGELSVATNDGVVYDLRFGEIFAGDDNEVEIGIEADKEKENDKAKESESKQSNRYLFVSTHFDPKFIGPPPTEPVPPPGLSEADAAAVEKKTAKPEAKKPAGKSGSRGSQRSKKPAKPKSGDDDGCGPRVIDDDAPEEAPADEPEANPNQPRPDADENDAPEATKPIDDGAPADEAPQASEKPATNKPEADKPVAEEKPARSPEELKRDYELLRSRYDADLKAYEDKLEAGKKKVEELNERFGAWYYVISADVFNKLHLSRKDLVKEKSKAADGQSGKFPTGLNPGNAFSPPQGEPRDSSPDEPDETPEEGEDSPTDATPPGEKSEESTNSTDNPTPPETPDDSPATPEENPADDSSPDPQN